MDGEGLGGCPSGDGRGSGWLDTHRPRGSSPPVKAALRVRNGLPSKRAQHATHHKIDGGDHRTTEGGVPVECEGGPRPQDGAGQPAKTDE